MSDPHTQPIRETNLPHPQLVNYPEGPPVKIWRWPDGRVSVAHAEWPDDKPPKPIRFTSTPDPDEPPATGEPGFAEWLRSREAEES